MNGSRRLFLAASAATALSWRIGLRHVLADETSEPSSPYLKGIFAPVQDEVTIDSLSVVGQIPRELQGTFVRNGPNPQYPPSGPYHLFEGDGMLHGVRLREGKASYVNRYVRTSGWLKERAAGKQLWPSLFDRESFPEQIRGLLEGRPPFKNTANTSVIWHHNKLLAVWELGNPHEIRLPDLETVGEYTFGGQLKHSFTAHPKIDPETGELLAFGYWVLPPYLQYSVIRPDGTIASTTPIQLPRPVMMHDVAITRHYTIFLDLPYIADFAGAMAKGAPFRFAPEFGARLGVLRRHAPGDQIQWFEIEPCFVFHVVNAFESGEDEVTLYACRMQRYPEWVSMAKPLEAQSKVEFQEADEPHLYQWVLQLKTGKVTETALHDTPCEMPRVNESLLGRNTRFAYALVQDGTQGFLKYDFLKRSAERHRLDAGLVPTEGVFVPRSDARQEDDGWLIAFLCREGGKTGELTIIATRDFAAPPVARIEIPQRVPLGFHGVWIPGEMA